MDPQFRTSFIPKKPITTAAAKPATTINLFALLATVIFIAAIALGAGVFFYQSLLQKQIDDEQASLNRAKGAFDPNLINQIVRLDSRIESSKAILAGHVAVTPLFNLLSQNTLRTVQFSEFAFQYLSPTKVQATLKGQADSYTSVALQSDQFNGLKSLSNTVFSDMSLNPTGTVSFSVVTNIDPKLVLYSAGVSPSASSTQSQ